MLPFRSLFAAIIQRLAGLSMGLIEMTLLKFYTYVVESAPHDSWPVFAFSKLANGPLKCATVLLDGVLTVPTATSSQGLRWSGLAFVESSFTCPPGADWYSL